MACICAAAVILAGCHDSPPTPPPPELTAASQALSNHQPETVIVDAKGFLVNQPTGPQAAEALYLEARGYEEKKPTDPGDRSRNLGEARSCYLLALEQSPPASLESDIYKGLSNVAYYQDQYADCIHYGSAAMEMTASNDPVQPLLLYRKGVSQQRLGTYTDADNTFRQVEQKYPNSLFAQAAKAHEGMRKFYIQLGTFDDREHADRATASLGNRGLVVSERNDNKGHTIIDVGSYETFPAAKKVRDSLQGEFPDAVIVP